MSTVVCGYDASPESQRALDWAAEEAVLRGDELRVLIALNWPEGARAADEPVSFLPSDRRTLDLATAALDTALEDLRSRHGMEATPAVELGAAIPMLLRESRTASLLVLGARGIGGFERMLLGSVSAAVAERASCPVVVVRAPAPRSEAGPYSGKVVVGVDGSAASDAAIAFAFDEAARRGAGLLAVQALHPDPILQALQVMPVPNEDRDVLTTSAAALLAAALAPWREKYADVEVTTFRMFGHPVTVLTYAATGCPLLVVGTRGRGDLQAAVLGSVSRGVLHHAGGPVVVVPHAG